MQNKNKYIIAAMLFITIAAGIVISKNGFPPELQGNLNSKITSIKSQNNNTIEAFDAYTNATSGLTFNIDKQQFDIAKGMLCISFNSSFATNNANITLPIAISIADTINNKNYKLDQKTLNISTNNIITRTASGITTYIYCEPNVTSLALNTSLNVGQSYTTTLTLDPDNIYKEQDESKKPKENNNTSSITFTYDLPSKYKPDLTVVNIAISKDKNVSWQVCDANFTNSKTYYTGKTFTTSVMLANSTNSAYKYLPYTLKESEINSVDKNNTSLKCFWGNGFAFIDYSSLAFKTGDTVTATIVADIPDSKDTSSSPNGYILESDEKNTFSKSIVW